MVKIGLVLSGGGTRGLAHVGALKAFEKYGFKFDAIAGCSVGAIIGYMYASGKTADEIEDFIIKQGLRGFLDFSISKLGINRTPKLRKRLETFTGINKFNDLKIPLYINATNISKGKEDIFKSGEVFDAIRASIAMPGLFAPHKVNGDVYIDGGIMNQDPFNIFPKDIKRFVIIHISPWEKIKDNKKLNLTQVFDTSLRIMQEEITKLRLDNIKRRKYIVIEPDLKKHPILENRKHFKQIIDEGEKATERKIDDIDLMFYSKHSILKRFILRT